MTKLQSSPRNPRRRIEDGRGFTLTELAVVLLIVSLLIGGTLMTLSAQNSAREISDTQRTLDLARDAILGFAIRNGRLPCWATAGSNGLESFCQEASGACTFTTVVQAHGRCFASATSAPTWVPAASLGIGPIETDTTKPSYGVLTDSWLQPIRYAVTQRDMTVTNPGPPPTPYWIALSKPFTRADGLKQIVLVPQKSPSYPPIEDLQVKINVGSNIFSPAVLYSTGKNRSATGIGLDEQENGNGDSIFVAHEPRPADAAGGEFDDIVIWISPNVLYNRLISAGAL